MTNFLPDKSIAGLFPYRKAKPGPVGKQTGTGPTTGFNEENVTVPKQSRIRQYPSQHNKLA